MPELAEVEAARRLVEKYCAGKVIKKAILKEGGGGPRDGSFDDIVFEDVTEAQALKHLEGKTLVSCHRKGKQQYWILNSGPHPCWHFGMTGSFSIKGLKGSEYQRYSVSTEVWPPKFCKALLQFEGGTEMAFTDPRRLGRVRFVGNPLAEPPVSELGWDPYLAMRPLPAFTADLSARSLPIKALLLDQSYCAGVGNWIADEVLYQARIHPESAACALDSADVSRLHAAIQSVVNHAVSVDAESDKFPATWLFHYRWGKGKGGAKMPDGNPIEFMTVGGRTSAVVRAVQGTPKRASKTQAVTSAASSAARAALDYAGPGAGAGAGGASAAVAVSMPGAAAVAVAKQKGGKRRIFAVGAGSASPVDQPAPSSSSSSSSSSSGAVAGTGRGKRGVAGQAGGPSFHGGAGAGQGVDSLTQPEAQSAGSKRRRPAPSEASAPVFPSGSTGPHVPGERGRPGKRRKVQEHKGGSTAGGLTDDGSSAAASTSLTRAQQGKTVAATIKGGARRILSGAPAGSATQIGRSD